MTIGIGDTLGAHRIVALLGKGGMGEVYRARDSRLKRDVAIKILPAEFAGDPDRLLRFRREAEVLASLNHPNIGAIYDFQEEGGTQFLVMELVEGETLAERLRRGPLPVEDALRIAAEMCEALDAAHEKGIIHRDLKPANVSIAKDGRVKVLDFGLAKAMEPARTAGTMANSPTLSLTATQAGVILGTAAYMAPEQAKGFEVDRRSDIFSFGCVLYEMLTGRQAFQGDTVPDVLASVLVREPDFTALSPAINPRLVELLQRCLHKNPKRRWHSAGDVREEIEIIAKNPSAAAVPEVAAPRQPMWRRAAPLVLAGALCGAAAAVAVWTLKPSPTPQLTRFAIALPEGQNFTRTRSHVAAVSPDGSMVAYAANRQIYLRRIGELEAQPVPGTNEDVGSPFFSPDGGSIGFFSFGDNAIKRIPISGGTALTVCSACAGTLGYGVDWEGDTIVFVRNGQEILKVPSSGGTPEVWVKADPGEVLSGPQFLPDRRVMFSVMKGTDWSKADIVILSESGERKVAVRGGSAARYLSSRHLMYAVGTTLYAVPFDIDEGVRRGDPVSVAQGLMSSLINYGAANFDVSGTGTLVYAVGGAYEADRQNILAIADRMGNIRPVPGLPPRGYRTPRVSPDETQVAMEVLEDASISVYDLSGTRQLRRLTLEGTNQMPVWSPDGTRIAFRSVRAGRVGLFVQNADGSGRAEELVTSAAGEGLAPFAWSEDDRIVFGRQRRLWLYSLKDRRAAPMPEEDNADPRTQFSLSLSRNSEWAAFISNEGRPPGNRVFLRRFPDGTKYLVSSELANAPVWSRRGLELFYFQDGNRTLVSVTVTPPPAFSLSKPVPIPIKSIGQAEGDLRQFDVMSNGRFLVLQAAPEEDGRESNTTQQIHVVTNWGDELKRVAPRR